MSLSRKCNMSNQHDKAAFLHTKDNIPFCPTNLIHQIIGIIGMHWQVQTLQHGAKKGLRVLPGFYALWLLPWLNSTFTFYWLFSNMWLLIFYNSPFLYWFILFKIPLDPFRWKVGIYHTLPCNLLNESTHFRVKKYVREICQHITFQSA